MDRAEKTKLTSINKIEEFSIVMEKLTTNKLLTEEEKSYILSCAIVFIKFYEEDRRYTSFVEFGYYIILKYSIRYNDYTPLFDFSVNFGFYPIAKDIIKHNLINQLGINNSLLDISLNEFMHNNHIETFEQSQVRNNILGDAFSQSISYIAPTSFGKSSIIIEHISRNNQLNKIGIIVPTKSLLIQTYRSVKEAGLDRKLIVHDEMFNEDERFIGILTQERALRLMDKFGVVFDILYIDEAHNLYEKDPRNILLSRLIRKNITYNPLLKTIYLSPLIGNSKNLKIDQQAHITEQRIIHNIKEPEIYEYTLSGNVSKFNRFANRFYELAFEGNYIEYIQHNKGKKNFIYVLSPKKIEKFAKELFAIRNEIDSNTEIQELIEELRDFVHEEFYITQLLKKGIIYLHGKIPDIVKEYLEYKFKRIEMLNFVVANTVILEGINLPIDTLFILNTWSLQGKELTNLIGRVNRLDQIFNESLGTSQLTRLLPQIHFVNTEYYGGSRSNMRNKIELLRSNIFDDNVSNPTLEAFDLDDITTEKEKERVLKIIENENLLYNDTSGEPGKLKKYLINAGLDGAYNLTDHTLERLIENIKEIDPSDFEWINAHIIEKIHLVFIDNLTEKIADFEFRRLSNIKARNFYKLHMFNARVYSLKKNVELTFEYFKRRISEGNSKFYFGQQYGEIRNNTEMYTDEDNGKEVYVDLLHKTDSEIINLSIVKIKIEDDFVSFKLNKMINALLDFKLISDEEYSRVVYGTNDEIKIGLIKTGLSINLINKLQSDNQVANITFDQNNNIKGNAEFERYKESLRGFYRFELEKFL